MVRPTNKVGPKQHLREVGINARTRQRYLCQLRRFFRWVRLFAGHIPSSLPELDRLASEFVNALWQEDDNVAYAGDFLSGLARFVPVARDGVPITRQFLCNWRRTVTRVRALPWSWDFTRAMAGVAWAYGRYDLAALFLVGFRGLLRTEEIVGLRPKSLLWIGRSASKVVVVLEATKTTTRKNAPEQVVVADPCVAVALRWACVGVGPCETVFRRPPRQFGDDIRWLAGLLGVEHPRLTAYGLRRGGATKFFHDCGSVDLLADKGRWQSVRAARIYVDSAVAQLAFWSMLQDSRGKLAAALRVFNCMIRSVPELGEAQPAGEKGKVGRRGVYRPPSVGE